MHLNIQDLLAILGPIGTLIGFMWYHFNNKFEKTDEKIENLRAELNNVEKKLGEKIDAVRDRVSRIEGQLTTASIVSFKPVRPKESPRASHSS